MRNLNPPLVPDERAQALVDLIDMERQVFEKAARVNIGELLGCGANGCVFRGPGDTVVKVSHDDGEAALARSLAGPRREPFLPRFHHGDVVKGRSVRMPPALRFGVVVREDLRDFMPKNLAAYEDSVKMLLDGDDVDLEGALREYDLVSRSTNRQPSAHDIEAIKAIFGLLVWGKENGIYFDKDEFSWEDDVGATGSHDEILPNAITNLGVTREGRIVVRDLGGFSTGKGTLRSVTGKLRRNVGPTWSPDGRFDRMKKAIAAAVASRSAGEWIFSTNDPGLIAVIVEADREWGPFDDVMTIRRGRALGIGSQDLRTLANLIDALERLHKSGFPRAMEAAESVMTGFPGLEAP